MSSIPNGIGIQILHVHSNAPVCPFVGNSYLSLVPGRGNIAQVFVSPTRMEKDRLRIFLHVVCDSWPASRNFEITPIVVRYHVLNVRGRLPAPQAIQTNTLPSRSLLPVCLPQIPNSLNSAGEFSVNLRYRGDYQWRGEQQTRKDKNEQPKYLHLKRKLQTDDFPRPFGLSPQSA